MTKDILQALIVLAIGIPFAYMAYDVTVDVIKKISKQAKPIIVNVIAAFTNLTK
ncbi:MAG: hypothetical protein JW956_13090 [Calditrichaceae bacterium]|nr:hypothetical protein [Calditrichaceae bacterium]